MMIKLYIYIIKDSIGQRNKLKSGSTTKKVKILIKIIISGIQILLLMAFNGLKKVFDNDNSWNIILDKVLNHLLFLWQRFY